MAHPDDNGQILSDISDIREYEFDRGHDSRDEQVAELVRQRDSADAARAAVQAEFDAHMATHEPEPAVCPPGTDRAGQEIPEGETEAWCTVEDPDPDPADKCLLGTSYGGADESFNDGRAEVARIFFTGNCPSDPFADNDYRQAYGEGVRHFVFSWKGSQTGAQLAACFNNIPPGVTAYGCYFHEPEDNIPSSMSLASWTSRHKDHAVGMRRAGVIPVTILMQYTLTAGSGRDVSDYHVGDDGFLFDAYFNPAKGKDNPEAVVDRIVAAGKAAGAKFVGLGETGTPNTVAQATAISLVKRLRAKLLATPEARLACYWPSGDFVFQSDAHADAWFEG